MNWIALFSFSGQELQSILKQLPDTGQPLQVFTNRAAVPINRLRHRDIETLLKSIDRPTLVTLHGYNRVLSPEVIANDALEIYNVHPGDVTLYPELRGLHPQRRALELKLPSTGVVIHRVTRDLDDGPIVRYASYTITEGTSEDRLIDDLRSLSVSLWLSFLQERLSL